MEHATMMHLEADKQIDWQKRERIVLAFFACGLIFFYLLALVAPQRWYDLYLSYGKAAVFAMASAICSSFSITLSE